LSIACHSFAKPNKILEMAQRPRYLHDIYSKEDIDIVSGVKRTYDCGYCPIALSSPKQFLARFWALKNSTYALPQDRFHSDADIECSLKLKYAVEVWKQAVSSISDDIVSYWGFRWIEGHFLTDGNDRDLLKIESLLLKYGASGEGYVLGRV